MSKPSRVQTISETTFNLPTVVATLTSVGLHGLIWVVEPALTSSARSGDGLRTVGVVQLTADEMSRLPEYSLPQLKLPPLPPPRPTNILPPLPPPVQSSLPPVQSNTTLPSVPVSPTEIPPLAGVLPSPSNPAIDSPNIYIPAQPDVSPTEKPNRRSSTARSQSVPKQPPQTPPPVREPARIVIPNEDPKREQKPPVQSPTDEPKGLIRESVDKFFNSQNSPNSPPQTNLQEEYMARGSDRDERFIDGRLPGGVQEGMVPPNSGNTRSNNNNPPRNNPVQPRENNAGGNTNSSADRAQQEAIQTAWREAQVLSLYGYSEVGTNEQDTSANLTNWFVKISDLPNLRNMDLKKLVTRFPEIIPVKSPFPVKLPRVNQANVAVLVDAKGKIIGEPELLRSTGFPQLNKAAIEAVKKRSFPAANDYKIYMYQLEIDQKDLPPASGASSNS